MTRGVTLVLLVVGLLVVATTGIRLEAMAEDRPSGDPLLYLPNGKYLKLASLGQLTAGAGVSLSGFMVDYAFGKHEYLDSSHRVSASYAF